MANDTLPQVSWIIPPAGYDEHPPSPPAAGMWFAHQVLSALVSNPKVWSKTVLFIMYDENDGFFDHVPAAGRPGGHPGGVPDRRPSAVARPGRRRTHRTRLPGPHARGVPVQPGGYVCSDTFDHTSQLRFLETRFGVKAPNISAWRRSVTGDLTSTLHVGSPDTSVPRLPGTPGRSDARVKSECTPSQLIEFDVTNPAPYPVPVDQSMPSQEPGQAVPVPT